MFSSPGATSAPAPTQTSRLQALGWTPFFAQQIAAETLSETPPVRIVEVHRNGLHALGEDLDTLIPPGPDATVGDWLLYDHEHPDRSQILDRRSLVKRKAPGTHRQVQLIAANIDTLFVVSSCNQDFNVARLERYIALAFDADLEPVILLTKQDLAEDAEIYVQKAQAISDRVVVIALDARGPDVAKALSDWCKPGQTVAFVGSSGVGKSTLANALSGEDTIATAAIREDDAKGRHTTTRRQLHLVPGGCLVLDTPGMRELQLADASAGIGALFADIEALSHSCRFRDCQHESEPDCAVLAALEAGEIDAPRLARWRKLMAEEAYNSTSLAERREKDRAFGKMVRRVVKDKKDSKR